MNTYEHARASMKARHFDEAIRAFEAHLLEQPEDVQALLELGICHLLGRSKTTFVVIHGVARRLLERRDQLSEELDRTWRTYRELFVAATASSLLLAACTARFDNAVELGALALPQVDNAQVAQMSEFLIPDPWPTDKEAKAMEKVRERGFEDIDYLHDIPHTYALVEVSPQRVAIAGDDLMPLIHGIIPEDAEVKGQLITDLYDRMLELAETNKAIAEMSGSYDHEFQGKVLLAVDRDIPFQTLRMVMYTLGQAQFSEFHFLVLDQTPADETDAPHVPEPRAEGDGVNHQLTVMVSGNGHELFYSQHRGLLQVIGTRGEFGEASLDLFSDEGTVGSDLDDALAQVGGVTTGTFEDLEELAGHVEPAQPELTDREILELLLEKAMAEEAAREALRAEYVEPVEPVEPEESNGVKIPCKDEADCTEEDSFDWAGLAQAVDEIAAEAGGAKLNVILVPDSPIPMQILTRTLNEIRSHTDSFVIAGGADGDEDLQSFALSAGAPAALMTLKPEDQVAVMKATLPAITYGAATSLPLTEVE